MNEAAKNIYLLFSVWTYTIISLGIAFRVNRGRFMLTLLVFQSGCPILCSCQQCMTVTPHTQQHLEQSIFLILAFLVFV